MVYSLYTWLRRGNFFGNSTGNVTSALGRISLLNSPMRLVELKWLKHLVVVKVRFWDRKSFNEEEFYLCVILEMRLRGRMLPCDSNPTGFLRGRWISSI